MRRLPFPRRARHHRNYRGGVGLVRLLIAHWCRNRRRHRDAVARSRP